MVFVKESLTFTGEDSPVANLLLSVMGVFAEFEHALILERQRDGIAAAKARGAYTGRAPALTAEQRLIRGQRRTQSSFLLVQVHHTPETHRDCKHLGAMGRAAPFEQAAA